MEKDTKSILTSMMLVFIVVGGFCVIGGWLYVMFGPDPDTRLTNDMKLYEEIQDNSIEIVSTQRAAQNQADVAIIEAMGGWRPNDAPSVNVGGYGSAQSTGSNDALPLIVLLGVLGIILGFFLLVARRSA